MVGDHCKLVSWVIECDRSSFDDTTAERSRMIAVNVFVFTKHNCQILRRPDKESGILETDCAAHMVMI